MRRAVLALVLLIGALLSALTSAHPMPSSEVRLHLRSRSIDAQLTLPIVELRLGWDRPVPMDAVVAVREDGEALKAYVRAHVRPVAPDGRPWTVVVHSVTPIPEQIPDLKVNLTMTPPTGAPADRLTLNYDVIFAKLVTHTVIVSIASDWHNGLLNGKPELLGTMRDTTPSIEIDRSGGSWWRGFAATFRLGAQHIAEGTDHLLFLLALLLPATLLVVGGRWKGFAGGKTSLLRIAKIVTAFTVGHSITLVLGALGLVHLPSAVIESVIALSILVSAVHALVPIFRGREIFIAGGFGLVHGLAFASILTGFGFDTVTLVSSVLGFNLGIEAFQLLLILVTMPWLILLARTRIYSAFRIAGAILTGLAAATWFFERAFGWPNPVGPVVERIAAHGVWVLVGLAGLAVVVTLGGRRFQTEPETPPAVKRG